MKPKHFFDNRVSDHGMLKGINLEECIIPQFQVCLQDVLRVVVQR